MDQKRETNSCIIMNTISNKMKNNFSDAELGILSNKYQLNCSVAWIWKGTCGYMKNKDVRPSVLNGTD